MFGLRCKNPSKLNFAYLNINSVRNKFENLIEIINENVDIFTIAETKLDSSFHTAQFQIKDYYSPFCLDITNKSGGLLVYIKSSIPSTKCSCDDICNSIQAIPFELNLRKEKWLVISIYHPPLQGSVFFLNSLTEIIDVFADKYHHYLIADKYDNYLTILTNFLDSNNLATLTKTSTCLKGKGPSVDLILTNRKYSFKNTSSYGTGLCDHHHRIYTMLKSCFVNIEPKQLNYRDFKNFSFESFKEDLSDVLAACTNSYETFEDAFKTFLDKYASKKKKWLRGNNKPHVNKMLRKAIMKRSKLKNKANKIKLPIDINIY